MKKRSMTRLMGAIALTTALTLGFTVAPAPVGAHPSDVPLQKNIMSVQFHLGVCRYKVLWGNFVTPYARLHIYNPTACGPIAVVVFYGTSNAASTTVEATGSDGCGTYSVIQANGPSGTATRALVITSTDSRYYDTDGTAWQTFTTPLC